MSKIMVFATPAYGHINPTLPVVHELVERGEEVIYYCHKDFRAQIAATGATFRAYPSYGISPGALAKCLENGVLANLFSVILEATEFLIPFTVTEIEREHPDLVIFDSIAYWGYMAIRILQVPSISFITHLVLDLKTSGLSVTRILGMASQSFATVMPLIAVQKRLIHTYGRNVLPPGQPTLALPGDLNIVFAIRELQPDVATIDDSYRFVGPSFSPSSREQVPTFKMPLEPFTYISLGTVHNSDLGFYHSCFEAFAGEQQRFLMSVGRTTALATLGDIPRNFSIYPFVPQLDVLQHAMAFITHGGLNSVQESLYFGVPMVVVPYQIEQRLNASIVASAGAGVSIEESLETRTVSPESLRTALQSIATQASYRTAVEKLQLRKSALLEAFARQPMKYSTLSRTINHDSPVLV